MSHSSATAAPSLLAIQQQARAEIRLAPDEIERINERIRAERDKGVLILKMLRIVHNEAAQTCESIKSFVSFCERYQHVEKHDTAIVDAPVLSAALQSNRDLHIYTMGMLALFRENLLYTTISRTLLTVHPKPAVQVVERATSNGFFGFFSSGPSVRTSKPEPFDVVEYIISIDFAVMNLIQVAPFKQQQQQQSHPPEPNTRPRRLSLVRDEERDQVAAVLAAVPDKRAGSVPPLALGGMGKRATESGEGVKAVGNNSNSSSGAAKISPSSRSETTSTLTPHAVNDNSAASASQTRQDKAATTNNTPMDNDSDDTSSPALSSRGETKRSKSTNGVSYTPREHTLETKDMTFLIGGNDAASDAPPPLSPTRRSSESNRNPFIPVLGRKTASPASGGGGGGGDASPRGSSSTRKTSGSMKKSTSGSNLPRIPENNSAKSSAAAPASSSTSGKRPRK